ncbi:MAG: DNA adenine methylase [Balneola sp.]|nr:MAG: DNA adenine methylase [Balneola sp.]
MQTPLRYPGGKQRLTPFVKEVLVKNSISGHYVEPYAGGSGVAIKLLLSRNIESVHLNDSDVRLFAFWYSLMNHTEELCDMILTASLTVEEWEMRRQIVKEANTNDLLQLGFSFFFLNRCNRSGVLSAGLIGGKKQTGNYKMDARFSRNNLIQRIESIAKFKDQIFIHNLDAEDFLSGIVSKLPQDDTLVYLDPPYYNKAKDLYPNFYEHEDHIRISEFIQNRISHKWILSYDGVSEVLDLYQQRRHFLYNLQYSASKKYKGLEVFIFSDDVEMPESSTLEHVNQGLKVLLNT